MYPAPSSPASHAIAHVEALFRQGDIAHYIKGQYIIRGEDEPDGVYLIDDGQIRIFGINQRGEDYTFDILTSHEIFPLGWLLHETHRQLFFQALSPCRLYRLPRERILREAQTDGQIAYGMLYKTLESFSMVVDRLDNLEYKYASERLAYRLLYLAWRFGEKQPGGSYIIRAQISQQLIASSINASRESVNREFERLQKKGCVGFTGAYIVIINIDTLKRECPVPLRQNWWGI